MSEWMNEKKNEQQYQRYKAIHDLFLNANWIQTFLVCKSTYVYIISGLMNEKTFLNQYYEVDHFSMECNGPHIKNYASSVVWTFWVTVKHDF